MKNLDSSSKPTGRNSLPDLKTERVQLPAYQVPDHKKTPIKEPSRKVSAKKKKKRYYRTLFFLTLSVLIAWIGALVGLGIGFLNQHLDQMAPISYLDEYRPRMLSRLFSGDDPPQLIADFFADGQNRKLVPLSDIPQNMINALLAIEDNEFFSHPGISPRGFIRAAYKDIKNRNLRQGGSTITMQLAEDLIKNQLLDYEIPEMSLKSFSQKIYEIILALQIEKRFTKQEILEFYLNQVFMGGNCYGIAAAAEYYFNKEVPDLSLKECALFAGMQQRPNAYSPTKNTEAAQKRTELVLKSMVRKGYVSQEECDRAIQEPFQLSTKGVSRSQIALFPYFSEAVRRQFLDNTFRTSDDTPINIYGQGIDIESTLQVGIQQAAENALRRGIVQHEHARRTQGGKDWGVRGYRGANTPGESTLKVNAEYDARIVEDYNPQESTIRISLPNVKGGQGPFKVLVNPENTWLDEFDLLHKGYFVRVKSYQEGDEIQFHIAKDEYVQGSLIAVRPSTGEVLAQVGGYDFNDRKNGGQFIRSIQASTLQPGSAFKPLLYTAALASKEKKWTLASTLKDEPKEYWAGWTPRNFYNKYYYSVSMLYALTHSLNAASVWLLDNYKSTRSAGIEHFRSFCRDVFDVPIEESNLSIALGTTGTTPMEIAQAYSVIANEGTFARLHTIKRIFQRRDIQQKQSLLLYEFKEKFEQRLTPEVAYLATSLMRNVIDEGTGQPAKDLPFFCVGKTGTTDECTYAWFAGYSKDILCVVYMGYDDFRRSLGQRMTGGKVALPVWIDFMTRVYEIRPELFGEITPPPGIVFHNVCSESGAIASSECPSRQKYPFEIGVEPPAQCPIHGKDSLRPYRSASNRFILMDRPITDNQSTLLNLD